MTTTHVMSGDGPYIMFIWIRLAKLKVKPVIWWGSSSNKLSLGC